MHAPRTAPMRLRTAQAIQTSLKQKVSYLFGAVEKARHSPSDGTVGQKSFRSPQKDATAWSPEQNLQCPQLSKILSSQITRSLMLQQNPTAINLRNGINPDTETLWVCTRDVPGSVIDPLWSHTSEYQDVGTSADQTLSLQGPHNEALSLRRGPTDHINVRILHSG